MAVQNKKRAKLIDVARHAGVSPGTVSNALHNTRFVEPQTRRRIEEAIVALNYTPNIRARQLRTGKTNTIALLSSVPLAIASGASRLGFMMEVALTSAMMALEKQHALILVPPGANPLDAVSFDAAILIEPAENDPQLQALAQAGIPASPLAARRAPTRLCRGLSCTRRQQHSFCSLIWRPPAPANVRYLSVTHGEHQFWRAKRLTSAGARGARTPSSTLSMKARVKMPATRPRSGYYRRIPTLTACWC